MLEAAKAEAETILDKARVHGREMLDEAKSARERVLGDLVRRRALLNAQIEALRGGRDRLLDAYRTVKRTFLDATEALAQVEARAAVERSASSNEAIDIAAEIAAEIEKLDWGGAPSAAEALSVDGLAADSDDEKADRDTATADDGETEVATALADVDSLFARLRAVRDAGRCSGERRRCRPGRCDRRGPRPAGDRRGSGGRFRQTGRARDCDGDRHHRPARREAGR